MFEILDFISNMCFILAALWLIIALLRILRKFYVSKTFYDRNKLNKIVKHMLYGVIGLCILGFIFGLLSSQFAPQEPLNLDLIIF